MENDYLWDKKGEDKEIEQLEKTLQVFRYQENTPPMLPKNVGLEKPIFSFFSLRFAVVFSACLTVLFGGVTVWLNLHKPEKSMLANQIQTIEISNVSPIKKVVEPISKPIVLPVKTEPMPKPKFIQTAFQAKSISPQIRRKVKPKVQLTKKEQDAYDQLMLALSITGSKLKVVQAKVNNSEETNPIREE